jgi:chemotaxis protein CheX
MQYLQNEIGAIVNNIWSSILAIDIQSLDEQISLTDEGRHLTGVVQIEGEWNGVVALLYPCTLARRIASSMFDVPVGDATLEDLRDAMAEMVNMTGGNIKGLLPGITKLSIPMVGEGDDYSIVVRGSKLLTRIPFLCEGEFVWVTLYETTNQDHAPNGRQHEANVC